MHGYLMHLMMQRGLLVLMQVLRWCTVPKNTEELELTLNIQQKEC